MLEQLKHKKKRLLGSFNGSQPAQKAKLYSWVSLLYSPFIYSTETEERHYQEPKPD